MLLTLHLFKDKKREGSEKPQMSLHKRRKVLLVESCSTALKVGSLKTEHGICNGTWSK
jgi:hypothetical protein